MPAIQGSRHSTNDRLRSGSRGVSSGPAGGRLRSALVVGEVALAITLLAGAGLLVRSFTRLTTVDPGFRPSGVTTFNALALASSLSGREQAGAVRCDDALAARTAARHDFGRCLVLAAALRVRLWSHLRDRRSRAGERSRGTARASARCDARLFSHDGYTAAAWTWVHRGGSSAVRRWRS